MDYIKRGSYQRYLPQVDDRYDCLWNDKEDFRDNHKMMVIRKVVKEASIVRVGHIHTAAVSLGFITIEIPI